MTNPNDIMGTNAGFGGRTSPNAFNDNLSLYSRGVVSGWACTPKSGMTVQLGGSATVRDVAIAEDNAGNKTTINNRLGTPVEITLSGAPVTNSRIDAIVAYVDNPAQGQATDVDYAEATGIIAVEGTASASPTVPNDSDIRSAITADGASGTTAYYVILATITVGTGVTTIGSGVISGGVYSQLNEESGQSVKDAIMSVFNLTSFSSQTFTSGYLGSSVTCDGLFYLAQSATSSTFKAYGNIYITRSANSVATLTLTAIPGLSGNYGIKTNLKLDYPPTTGFIIAAAGVNLRVNSTNTDTTGSYQVALGVGTDGYIYLGAGTTSTLSVAAQSQLRWILHPCLYFNTNFGDGGSE